MQDSREYVFKNLQIKSMFLNIFACVGLFFKGWAAFEPKQFAKN